MASPLRQVVLRSPGFLGLNTEQSAANVQARWATQLDNAVFDESGKIAARKGFTAYADSNDTSPPDTVHYMTMYRRGKAFYDVYAVGDNSGTPTLYKVTSGAWGNKGTLNTTDAYMFTYDRKLVILDDGYTPKYANNSTNATDFAAATAGSNPTSGIGCSAFGRLFMADANRVVVYGSDIGGDPTTGIDWANWYIDTTGASGTGVVNEGGWTIGQDYITAIAAFKQRLIVFGAETILIYSDPNGTSVTLEDAIVGVGCVNQRTLCHTGDDLLFLSKTGVRSLRRTIQYETPELNDISAFVRTDLIADIDPDTASAAYDPSNSLYLLSDGVDTYAFDTREIIPLGRGYGAMRCSKWSLPFVGADYDLLESTLYLAQSTAIGTYSGYQDAGESYKLTLKSAWLDLGSPRLKIIKQITADIYNGDGITPKFSWSFDFDSFNEISEFGETLPAIGSASEWNVAEWSIGEWGGFSELVTRRTVQGSGTGRVIRYGVEFLVDGSSVGLLQLTVNLKLGRLGHE